MDLVIKKWFCLNEVKEEQLKKYKIWGGGLSCFVANGLGIVPVSSILTNNLKTGILAFKKHQSFLKVSVLSF